MTGQLKTRPNFSPGDKITCEDEEYECVAVYQDSDDLWVVDYKDKGGLVRKGFPHIWFKLRARKIPAVGQTSQEIKEESWDKCSVCGRTCDFIYLGYNCPVHGAKA